jgi:hypothetical protein
LLAAFGSFVWTQPEDGTDGAGMLALSLFFISAAGLLAGVVSIAFALWRRRHAPRHSATPMWHPDPWREARWRFWNGDHWTQFTA